MLYCGLVRERGTVRTSTTRRTSDSLSRSTKVMIGRVECPIVKNGLRMSAKFANHGRFLRWIVASASNAPHRLESCARVDLGLREHRRLRPEALDDSAHEWPRACRGHEHGGFTGAGGFLEALAHQG